MRSDDSSLASHADAPGPSRDGQFPAASLHPHPTFSPAIVKLVDAQRSFQVGQAIVPALRKVTASFPTGSISAVIGPDACGKSTLLACIAGQESLSSGHLYVDSRPMTALGRYEIDNLRGRTIGFASHRSSLVPSLTVAENIAFHADMTETEFSDERFNTLITAFELGSLIDCHPSELSLQQRYDVSVARELLLDPPLLLLDEPGRDPQSPGLQRLMRFLASDNRRHNRTVIFATSHPAVAAHASHVFFMAEGRIVAHMDDPTPDALSKAAAQLDSWDAATAFLPVKDMLSASQLKFFYGEVREPQLPPSEERIWDGQSSRGGNVWPAMPDTLRQRLQELRQDQGEGAAIGAPSPQGDKELKASAPSAQASAMEAPPGLGHLTGGSKDPANIDLAALSQLLGVPQQTHSSARIIPLDDDATSASGALVTSENAQNESDAPQDALAKNSDPAPKDDAPAPKDDAASASDSLDDDGTQADLEDDAPSMADINRHIVRMKARLRTMAEQAERRLASMERSTDDPPQTSPPKPASRPRSTHGHSSALDNDERWEKLLSSFANSPADAQSKEEEPAPAPAHEDKDIDDQARRRLELLKMMEKAQTLLRESDSELEEVRSELNRPSQERHRHRM